MKKMILAIALLAGAANFQPATAQVRVNINIGSQPLWGPSGYDYAQYYYMPELGVYYDISNRLYYYQDRGRWTGVATLPGQYSRYNLYNTYKVVVNDRTPWLRDRDYRRRYASYARRHDQGAIRDSRDRRYWEIADHPHHSDWERDRRGGNPDVDRQNDRRNRRPR